MKLNRSLLLLSVCQALFLTNNVTFIAINGLVGLQLAPNAWLATLPVKKAEKANLLSSNC